MEINKAEPPEDEREISLNETSLKRPLNVVDVIGGHGPWQFRQWIVFLLASLCNSVVLFSALFLPSQTFCSPENSTGIPSYLALHFEANNTFPGPEARNSGKQNSSSHPETVGSTCNSTSCKGSIRMDPFTNGSDSDVSPASLLIDNECWTSQAEILAKCIYFLAAVSSAVLVYLSRDRFGRRPAAVLSSVILVGSSLATGWADSAAVFLILRFIASLGTVSVYFVSAISLLEYVHEDFKLLYFLTGHLGWGMAHLVLPAMAWMAEDWRSFNILLSTIGLFLSFFVWWSPESPSAFPERGGSTRTRKALKYAAFTNGYSTTGVDLLSHNYHLRPENKHELGTLASTKSKVFFVFYCSVLFFFSFTTAFLYFATKWHPEWFKVAVGRVSFSFLGTTEVASAIILLFLTCFVSIQYLWAVVSALSSILIVVIFSRSSDGSSKSSAILYTATVFFAAAAWTLGLAKSFCHKISGSTSKLNLKIIGIAAFAGALAASAAVVLKEENQDLLLILAIPHLILAVTAAFVPQNVFGTVA